MPRARPLPPLLTRAGCRLDAPGAAQRGGAARQARAVPRSSASWLMQHARQIKRAARMRRSCRCVGLRSSRGACVRACACTRSTHLPRGMCVCGVRAGNGGTRGCSGKRTFRCSSTTTTTTGRGELLSGSCALFATTSLRARHAAPCTPSIARTLARPRCSSSAEQQPVPVARFCAKKHCVRSNDMREALQQVRRALPAAWRPLPCLHKKFSLR